MKKINVAELLKDCPQGMELDCTMYDNLYFDSLNADYYGTINCYTLIDGIKTSINFTKYGTFNNHMGAKCVIFPKGKTSWEGFVPPCKFKDGDIIFTHANCLKVGLGNTWISIFQEKRNGGVATYVDYAEDGDGFYSYNEDKGLLCMEEDIMRQRFATEEEKQKLFQVIKENGYKWNPETKTLEKLPKFKVGDKIKEIRTGEIYTVTDIYGRDDYISFQVDNSGYAISYTFQDEYELVPNKFDITTLKPFDKVLVRNHEKNEWQPNFFNKYCKGIKKFKLIGICTSAYGNIEHFVDYCIPYEGNEHLSGKTDDCAEYFKTWE